MGQKCAPLLLTVVFLCMESIQIVNNLKMIYDAKGKRFTLLFSERKTLYYEILIETLIL